MPSTDSASIESSTTFQGLWIHDPLDPEGTIHQFLYARSARGVGIDVEQQGMVFAGRQYPVFDYGENQQDSFKVRIDIPNGSTWADEIDVIQDFAQVRRTLCFRDNRGRVFFGTMKGYEEADQDWGTSVAFAVERASYDEAVA